MVIQDIFTEKSPGGVAVVNAEGTTLAVNVTAGGGGTNNVGLTDYGTGSHSLATGTYVEASIVIKSGATGTIEGTAAIALATYTFRAEQGKTLGQIDFVVSTGQFQVLTVEG